MNIIIPHLVFSEQSNAEQQPKIISFLPLYNIFYRCKIILVLMVVLFNSVNISKSTSNDEPIDINRTQSSLSISDLHDDCLILVFSFLNTKELLQSSAVNKKFHRVINNECQRYVRENYYFRDLSNATVKSFIAYRCLVENLHNLILCEAESYLSYFQPPPSWGAILSDIVYAYAYGEKYTKNDMLSEQVKEITRQLLLERTIFTIKLMGCLTYISPENDCLLTENDLKYYKKYDPYEFLTIYETFYNNLYNNDAPPITQIPEFDLIPFSEKISLEYKTTLVSILDKLKNGGKFQDVEEIIYDYVTSLEPNQYSRLSYEKKLSDCISSISVEELEKLEFILLFSGCGDNFYRLSKQDRYNIIYKISYLDGEFSNKFAGFYCMPVMLANGDFDYRGMDTPSELQNAGVRGSPFAQYEYAKLRLSEKSQKSTDEIYNYASKLGWIGAQSALIEKRPCKNGSRFILLNFLKNDHYR